jgi:murein DD-endopeptidase MepM/ murein hydrolase activator NlpD
MKKLIFFLILNGLLASSCATHGPFYVGIPYGASVPYGEGRHPGIDFDITVGTPIIASSDGVVTYIWEPNYEDLWRGGISVVISQVEDFTTFYAHLTKIFIEKGQSIKRGQLIGLSGANNRGYAHLHFGICKSGRNCIYYSNTYEPNKFWLGGKAQCFDPNKDYSNYSKKDITLPIACGEYAKELVARTKRKD